MHKRVHWWIGRQMAQEGVRASHRSSGPKRFDHIIFHVVFELYRSEKLSMVDWAATTPPPNNVFITKPLIRHFLNHADFP